MNKNLLIAAVSREKFKEIVEKMTKEDINNFAFISIENSDVYVEAVRVLYEINVDNDHILPNKSNVLNLNFDDISKEEMLIEDCTSRHKVVPKEHRNKFYLKCISEEDSDRSIDFIEKNLGKNLLIHCSAGKSRSQAFFRFIVDYYYPNYVEHGINLEFPCTTPNICVLNNLKKSYIRKNDKANSL